MRLPGEQHLAVFGDLVLLFLGRGQIVGVDVLQPEEHPRDAGLLRLLDESIDLVAHGIDLDHDAERNLVHLAQLGQPVEDRFPFLVACEIVVGDEEARDVLRPVVANDPFDVVGGAEARLAALHVDDGAERALKRAAAAGIEARVGAGGALDELKRQERNGRPADPRQIVHVVVERLELALGRVAQNGVEPAFRLAGKQGNPHVAGKLKVDGRAVEHRQAAGHVEAAHRHRNVRRPDRPRDIERAGILVGLHADQAEQTEVSMLAEAADQLRDIHPGVGLVDDIDIDGNIGTQDLALRAVECEAVNRGERVGRDQRPPPADDIAVIVVMRGLYEDELKAAFRPNVRIGQDIHSGGAPKAVAAKSHVGLFAKSPRRHRRRWGVRCLEKPGSGSNCPGNGLARATNGPSHPSFCLC